MGVKDLWTILSPVSEKKSLWELKDKSIAVDLSAWICDSQKVGDNSQRNMYLRNLFFRTSFLLLLGVKPIFVLEGKAPQLKTQTIFARCQARHGGNDQPKSIARSHLRSLQKQCEKLLKAMGILCVQSSGEAEAYCAWLNETGFVDAVITQDSDCLLYGAKVVLRNFTMSPGFTCDAYDMGIIEEKLKLGRQKLLALCLLCGSDYDKGVNGVGKESALKFLASLDDCDVIDRLRSWTINPYKYNLLELKGNTNLTALEKLELNIRKKALMNPGFPSEDIINEFMLPKSSDSLPIINWHEPDLTKFLEIADRQLVWEEKYSIEKFLPLMTRWHLLNPNKPSMIKCVSIVKKRVVKGISSYECIWSLDDLMLDHPDIVLSTTEPQDILSDIYKDIVDTFIASKVKPKKASKNPRKKKNEKDINNDEANNIIGKLMNKPSKKRSKNKTVKGLQTLDEMLFNLSVEENKTDEPDHILKDISHKLTKLDRANKHAVNRKQTHKKRLKDDTENGFHTLHKYMMFKNRNENVIHSTPNRNVLSERCDSELNVSYHYLSDASPSPVRIQKKRDILTDTKCRKSIITNSIDETAKWSLSDFLIKPTNQLVNPPTTTIENEEIKKNEYTSLSIKKTNIPTITRKESAENFDYLDNGCRLLHTEEKSNPKSNNKKKKPTTKSDDVNIGASYLDLSDEGNQSDNLSDIFNSFLNASNSFDPLSHSFGNGSNSKSY